MIAATPTPAPPDPAGRRRPQDDPRRRPSPAPRRGPKSRRRPRPPAAAEPSRRARRRAAAAAAHAAARPGPKVLMGLVWAALLVAAAEVGPGAMAVLVMPVALVAAVSGVRAVAGDGAISGARPAWLVVPPRVAIAVAPSVVLPLAALGGLSVAVGVGVALLAGAVALLVVTTGRRFPIGVLVAAFAPAIAVASVVVAREQGLSEVLTLVIAVCLYDMASFVTGTGPRGGPAGVIVGMITVGILAVFAAAVLVPPYSGRSPWILLGLVAVLAPVGVLASSRIGPGRRLPALRRLDSLVLAGPAWVIAVSLLLHR